MAKSPGPVEGYNMLIWEHEDGSVSYTGSFHAAEWERYLSTRSTKEVREGTTVPDPTDTSSSTDADLVEQPAGNASVEAWRAYALTQGATEDEVADLSRNELRDQYRTEE
jgi:hypothetical protein